MKTLEQNFVMNADKCGDHTFTQTRREGNICCYRRNKVDDERFHSFEVFIIRVVKAGSPLPGGGSVAEDYEPYPGKSAFGRTAWSINTEQRANTVFNGLLSAKHSIPEPDTTTAEETELVNVVKVVRPKSDRRAIKFPKGPFTQKELAAFNSIENYKEVYTDLQRALADGTLKISAQVKEVSRGRAAKMFELTAAGKAAVKA
jgi:hypothetical protein